MSKRYRTARPRQTHRFVLLEVACLADEAGVGCDATDGRIAAQVGRSVETAITSRPGGRFMPKKFRASLAFVLAMTLSVLPAWGQGARPRARDLGVPFDGTPGPLNAITDVRGIEVGHKTLVVGEGPLVVGKGPVRTGVTAILPRGRASSDPVFAGWFAQNGNGEMTGTTWIEESGFLDGPMMLTNTSSVGVVRDAVIAWHVKAGRRSKTNTFKDFTFWYPVVAETADVLLNDIHGQHVKDRDAVEALESARGGPVAEGSVGGGTGMVCYEFKGGIGTASRRLPEGSGGYAVGVLVQANCGIRSQLRIAGVPIGREITEGAITVSRGAEPLGEEIGSIIIVVATDAPLLPHQLKRVARRASMGLARTGAVSHNGSGDIFLAFSTANPGAAEPAGVARLDMLPNDRISPIFEATVQATEEAIVNALVAADTMTGIDGRTVIALPHGKLAEVLRKYNHLVGR